MSEKHIVPVRVKEGLDALSTEVHAMPVNLYQ